MDQTSQKKLRKTEYLLLFFVFFVTVGMFWSFFQQESGFTRYEAENTTYEKATVREILEQELVLSGVNHEYFTGYQKVKVCLTQGAGKDTELVLDNYITLTHNIVAEEGMHVIICADRPDDIEPYYSIYNYDRSFGITLSILAFFLLIIIIGKYRGVRAGIGLSFTLAVILCYMMPELYEGGNEFLAVGMTLVSSCIVSSFCISGLSIKTVCNMVNTIMGVAAAVFIYFVLTKVFHLHGGSLAEAEMLQLISNNTGLSLYGVMFAGIIIGVLGAVMDVAVSQCAALWELKVHNPAMTATQLLKSGMNIGKDMIGTMINTLIFAFMGGTLPTLFIFISYGVNFQQFLSSDFLALELAMGLAGSGAVMLTVPISAFICGLIFEKGVEI